MPPRPRRPSLAQLKQLSHDEVLALAGLGDDGTPRSRSWCNWQKPSPALPIDHAIEQLLERTRSPKVPRSRRARQDLCPYREGRFFSAFAATNASHDEAEWNRTFNLRIEKLAAIVSRSGEVASSLGGLMGALKDVSFSNSPAPHSRLDDVVDYASGYAAKDFLQAIEGDLKRALTEVSSSASEARSALGEYSKRRDANVWQAAFAFRIGQLWCLIFEDIPGRGNDSQFVDLIGKAFETVCSDEGVSWMRAKTAAFARHDEAAHGDGFDRYLIRAQQPTRASDEDIAVARTVLRERLAAASARRDAELENIRASLEGRHKGTLN